MAMPSSSGLLPLRRIVTYHNERGQAVVQRDTQHHSKLSDIGPGIFSGSLWVTKDFPTTDCNNSDDAANREIEEPSNFGLVHPTGTNLRFTDLAPGAITPTHRTTSVDYNVLIQGELILIMEDGSETHLKNPGDTVVQKGTLHAWKNPGSIPSRWVTTLIPAEGAIVDGSRLGPELLH